MAASDARPVPIKNTAFRLYFALRDNTGALLTSWTGQDTELSKDGAALVAATNEATEIGGGIGYIDLTSGEMNYDCVAVKISVSNANAIIPVFFLYPREAADLEIRHADGVESGLSAHESIRLQNAALFGKLSGAATTTVVMRDPADSKDRITATVDSNGNRTAITTDAT